MAKDTIITEFRKNYVEHAVTTMVDDWNSIYTDEIATLNNWIKAKKKTISDNEKLLNQQKDILKKTNKEIKEREKEIVEFNKETLKIEASLDKYEQEVETLRAGNEAAKAKLPALQKKIDDASDDLKTLEEALNDTNTAIDELQNKKHETEAQISRFQDIIDDHTKELNLQSSESTKFDKYELDFIPDSIEISTFLSIRDVQQKYASFDTAMKKALKQTTDFITAISSFSHQPGDFKATLSEVMTQNLGLLKQMHETGRKRFDSSEALAIEESKREQQIAEDVRSGKIKPMPPVVLFNYPNLGRVLRDNGLSQEQLERLPIKGGFECVIGDIETRSLLANSGFSAVDIQKVSDAAAQDVIKTFLVVEAKNLLKQLDAEKITEEVATKRWKATVNEAITSAVDSATAEIERLCNLKKNVVVADIKSALSIVGKIVSIAGAVVGAVIAGMVGNVAAAALLIVGATQAIVSLGAEIKTMLTDLMTYLDDVNTSLKSVLTKYNLNEQKLNAHVREKTSMKDGVKAITSSFINNIIGIDAFATVNKVKEKTGIARDKLNNIELNQRKIALQFEVALDHSVEMDSALKSLMGKAKEEGVADKLAKFEDLANKAHEAVSSFLADLDTRAKLVKTAMEKMKVLEAAVMKLFQAKAGLKWCEIAGDLLGTASTAVAGQLLTAPKQIMDTVDSSLRTAKDVLTYSNGAIKASTLVIDELKS